MKCNIVRSRLDDDGYRTRYITSLKRLNKEVVKEGQVMKHGLRLKLQDLFKNYEFNKELIVQLICYFHCENKTADGKNYKAMYSYFTNTVPHNAKTCTTSKWSDTLKIIGNGSLSCIIIDELPLAGVQMPNLNFWRP